MDRAEFVELFRKSGGALGPASPTEDRDGDGSGETWSCSEPFDFGVSVGADVFVGGGSFGGSGNKGLRCRFNRGMRNRLLVDAWPSRGELVRND